jgi:hypothetical protein
MNQSINPLPTKLCRDIDGDIVHNLLILKDDGTCQSLRHDNGFSGDEMQGTYTIQGDKLELAFNRSVGWGCEDQVIDIRLASEFTIIPEETLHRGTYQTMISRLTIKFKNNLIRDYGCYDHNAEDEHDDAEHDDAEHDDVEHDDAKRENTNQWYADIQPDESKRGRWGTD